MLLNYIQKALHQAKYEVLTDDKSWYAEIPGFRGVYANAQNLEDCRNELQEVLEEWILFRIHKQLPIPEIDGLELKIREVA